MDASRMGSKKMPKGGWKTVRRLFGYVLGHYKFSFLVVAVCIVVTSFTTLASTLFTKTLIDDYIVPLTAASSPDYGPLEATLLKLAAVLLVGVFCSWLQNRLMINVGQGTLLRLREDMFSRMERLPVSYFDNHPHGDIMSVYSNDVDTLREMISRSLPQLLSSSITITITFVSMVALSWQMTILVVIMSGVMALATRKLGNRAAKYFKARQENLGALNGYVEEMLRGQKVVKTFCHEDEAVSEFSVLNEALRDSVNNANRTANIVMPVNGNLSNLTYVLCAVLGASMALGGAALTVGSLVSFLTLIKSFTQPISQISQQFNNMVMAVAGADRVFGMMDETPEKDDMADVTLVNAKEMEDGTLAETEERTGTWAWKVPEKGLVRQMGEVDFLNVDFSYVPGKQVLYDIVLDTDAKQKIALVGGTGAGKTTIINLINRFYSIDDGRILYDGIDVRRIRLSDLRRSLGMVLQDTHLFSGTVMDNIRYGRLDATDEQCRKAAELAGADDFIRRLANGYDTVLSADGGNLSQGERQLLAIARAVIADPPALILDEATSSIDTRTERMIQAGMDKMMQGRSTFVIAHRLSTIRNADTIVVMDKGHIRETGSHDELMSRKGMYYALYTGNQLCQ